jgi:DNA-binding transcriptional LysR family regulator
MSLDPRLLRPFVVLAEELHFGRAAERLHVAQPALSQQIQRLEVQLDLRLFDRSRGPVRLTEAGAAALGPARAAVEAAAAVHDVARSFAAGESGELRVGVSPGAHYLAQAMLAELARRCPDVHVRAVQDSSGALVRQVAAGELELALGFCSSPVPGVGCEPLRREPVVVAVADGHRLGGKGPLRLESLRDEAFALVDAADGPGYNDAVRALCRGAGFEPRTPPAPTGPMVWEAAVRSGDCVGLTARTAAVSTARGTRLLDLEEDRAFSIELVRPAAPESGWRPASRRFASLVRELGRAR